VKIKQDDLPIDEGQVLAERTYWRKGNPGVKVVTVRIGRPRVSTFGPHCICRVEIDDGTPRYKAFGGPDALEALLGALSYIGVELWWMYRLPELTWDDSFGVEEGTPFPLTAWYAPDGWE